MLGLHENHLDFEILESGNPKTLIFVDSSSYMEEPDRPMIEVTLPGYNKYLLANVEAKHLNTFNSSTLGWNKTLFIDDLTDLPDGVWQIRYKICPYKYIYKVKFYMRVTQLNLKLEHLYNTIDLNEKQTLEDKEIQSNLVQIHTLIEGAKAAVKVDIKKAQDYYQLADKMIQKQLDKFCKNCN